MEYGNWDQRAAQPPVGSARGTCEALPGEALQKNNPHKLETDPSTHGNDYVHGTAVLQINVFHCTRGCCDVSTD